MQIEHRPDPTPQPDEVVIQVARCGICGTDLAMTEGSGPLFDLDSIPGHEFAGEIVAIGCAVSRLKVGDRVTAMPFVGCGACATCLAGRPNFCPQFRGMAGGFAEYVAANERVTVKLPSCLSTEDGALIEPLAVSLHGIALAQMPPGARVLIIGAGPIGLGALYWARRQGAGRVAVAATSHRREAIARQLGADDFLVPAAPAELPAMAEKALAGKPDLVIEAGGKPGLIAQAIDCVRAAGSVVVLGFCSAIDSFVPAVAVWKEVRVLFSMTYGITDFESVARTLDRDAEEARSMVTDTVTLSALPETLDSMRRGSHQCKVLVNPQRVLFTDGRIP